MGLKKNGNKKSCQVNVTDTFGQKKEKDFWLKIKILSCSTKSGFGNIEKRVERILRDILRRGNNAEVRQDKDGRMVIYEVEKKKDILMMYRMGYA